MKRERPKLKADTVPSRENVNNTTHLSIAGATYFVFPVNDKVAVQ